MSVSEITLINDGDKLTKKFIQYWEIEEYCEIYNQSNLASFVGLVVKKNKVLYSFPKHYEASLDDLETMEKILNLIELSRTSIGSFDKGTNEEFPIKAYLSIASYYRIYGLFMSKTSKLVDGYGGKIDWKRTLNKSNKVITKEGIIFFPFKIKKSYDINVFLSDCMEYILDDADNYKNYIPNILNYKIKTKNKIFENLDLVLKKLNRIKTSYFKDHEKNLIQGIIDYINWKSIVNNTVKLLTLNFENYWENMVNIYLNIKFQKYDNDSNRIIWGENENLKFQKPPEVYVESEYIRNKYLDKKHYKIRFDHYSRDDENIYLFDSKYFSGDINELNYKQVFYHYYLKREFEKISIVNGLLLPTSKEYYVKTHVDRTDLDGVKIIEHYINLKRVLNCVFENKRLLKIN